MKAQITVDRAGRVLIPKELRDRLGFGPGDVLDVVAANDQISLKPIRQTIPLEKRYGFWICTGEFPAQEVAPDALALVADDREARAAALLGGPAPEKKRK